MNTHRAHADSSIAITRGAIEVHTSIVALAVAVVVLVGCGGAADTEPTTAPTTAGPAGCVFGTGTVPDGEYGQSGYRLCQDGEWVTVSDDGGAELDELVEVYGLEPFRSTRRSTPTRRAGAICG